MLASGAGQSHGLGLFAASSVNVRVPVAGPVAVGENVTPMVQVAPAAMFAPQVLLATAKPALARMLEKLSCTFPWLVKVTVLAALVTRKIFSVN
jgi:hypothetical protein